MALFLVVFLAVVDHLVENKLLPMGAAFMLGNAMLELS